MSRQPGRGPSQRQLRVGEEVRHLLAEVFERADFRDPDLQNVRLTVTEVRPSPDMKNATVYVIPLGGQGDMAAILAGLERVKGYLRHEVGRRMHIKVIPKLNFAADTTFDEAGHIDALLHSPEVARDLDAPGRDEERDEEEDD